MTAWNDSSTPTRANDLTERGRRWDRVAASMVRGLAPRRPWLRTGEGVNGRYPPITGRFIGAPPRATGA